MSRVSQISWSPTLIDAGRGQAFQPGHGMVNRFMMAHGAVEMRRWGRSAIAAMATLAALTADAAAREARPAPAKEATAPREAGEPIMAIVSIKTQQVIIYDADGWIVRAPVSTGVKGRENAGRHLRRRGERKGTPLDHV